MLNCLPGLGTFSSCGGHPPPLDISQAPEGHYWINFCIDPWDGGWGSLQNLAYVMADMENVTIKIWLSGYEPDTIAFELAGVGDPLDLAAIIEEWRTTGQLPEDLRWGDPEVTGQE